MVEAVIKGEVHLSKKDKQALEEYDLSRFDAVFREGYNKNLFQRDLNTLYALFAIGHLVYGATFGRIYFSSEVLQANAEKKGVPYYDEIDAAVHETYEMVPRWKRLGLAVLSPVWAVILVVVISLPLRWAATLFPSDFSTAGQVAGAVVLLLCFGFLCALGYFIMVVGEVMYSRDEKMADEIFRISEKEDYDTVFVSVGGDHRRGIAKELEEEGWEVREETSDSLIGKILVLKDRILRAVLNPVDAIRKARS